MSLNNGLSLSSMLPHYRQPQETGQGDFDFQKLIIRRLRRLRKRDKEVEKDRDKA
jgi:hypothetical protein